MYAGVRPGILARPGLVWSVLTCTLFALMTGVFARVAIPLPFTPVPFTLQPMAVVLTGFLLGSRLGAAAMVEYFIMGALGAPVFAGGFGLEHAAVVTGSLGYIIGYPFAAWVTGRLSERSSRAMAQLIFAGCVGMIVLYTSGVAYLAGWMNVVQHVGGLELIRRAIVAGAFPFILFDVVKVAIAASVSRRKLFD